MAGSISPGGTPSPGRWSRANGRKHLARWYAIARQVVEICHHVVDIARQVVEICHHVVDLSRPLG